MISVVDLNVKRRNLTAGQRAVAAAEAWDQAEAEGKVQGRGGDRRSKGNSSPLKTRPAAHFADLFGTSDKSVKQARALDPDLREAVKAGTMPLAGG